MDYIINTILSILEQNRITIYSFAKTTKISKSTLYKVLHFERTLKPKYFYTIVNNLPLSIEEKEDLTFRYKKIILGEEYYESELHIFNLLKNFLNSSNSLFKNVLLPLPNKQKFPISTDTFYKGDSIKTAINLFLLEEMHNTNPRVYVYAPGDSSYINTYINNIVLLYNTNIKITFIFDFIRDKSNCNLKILENIIPLALTAHKKYDFYYTYVNSILNNNYMTLYPYFIIFSDKILFINSFFNEALAITNAQAVKNISTLCKVKLANYKKLLDVTNEYNIVNKIEVNSEDITTYHCIKYEPCFPIYFTKEMLHSIVLNDLPNKEQLLEILEKKFIQLENCNKSIQIFNKNSLLEFAQTGIINEFPTGYTRPCTKDERFFILKKLMSSTEQNNKILVAFNPEVFQFPVDLSLTIQDESILRFIIWSHKKFPLKSISITEYSIIKKFHEFIMNIIDTNVVYSQKETKNFIQKAMDYLNTTD